MKVVRIVNGQRVKEQELKNYTMRQAVVSRIVSEVLEREDDGGQRKR